MLCRRKFPVPNELTRGGKARVSICSVNFFCLVLLKNVLGGPFCLSQIFWYQKILWTREKQRVSRSSSQKILSHRAEKFHRGTPLRCHLFRVSKKFVLKKVMSEDSVETSLCHPAELFHQGSLWCFNGFAYRKTFCLRGLCHYFLSNFFCLTVPENFIEGPFSVSLISDIEKLYA